MKRILVLAFSICASWCVHAQYATSVRGLIHVTARTFEDRCAAMPDPADSPAAKENPELIPVLRSGYQNLCVCTPTRLRALLDTLPDDVQTMQIVTDQEFIDIIKPAVLDKCAAEKFREMFGESCEAAGAGKLGKDAPRYCACMKESTATFTEAEAAGLGLEAADYIPQAAEAQKKGEPVPEPPALMKRLLSVDKACGGAMSKAFEARPAKKP